jgi:hypothetical protein
VLFKALWHIPAIGKPFNAPCCALLSHKIKGNIIIRALAICIALVGLPILYTGLYSKVAQLDSNRLKKAPVAGNLFMMLLSFQKKLVLY